MQNSIRILKIAGIRGELISWFRSYLKNRRHRVKINNVTSEELTFKYGVPQGSVLGPLLFIVYINDLFALPLRAETMCYADDTSLLYSEATAEEMNYNFQPDVELLLPWLRKNYLHLNTDKCKNIIYAYKKPSWYNSAQLKMENTIIENVDVVKYLELFLDSKLT